MNIKHILLLGSLLTYPTQSLATREPNQTYARARAGIHAFSQGMFMPTSVEGDVLKVNKHGTNMDLRKIHVRMEPWGIVICYREDYYDEAFSEMRSLHASATVGTLYFNFDESSIRSVQLTISSGEVRQYAVLHTDS